MVFAESQARLVGAARSGEVRVAGHTELSRFRNSGRKFLEYWQNRRGRAGLPGFFDYDVDIEEIEASHICSVSGYLKVTVALSYPFSLPSSFRNLVIGSTSEDSSLSSIWVRFDFEFSQIQAMKFDLCVGRIRRDCYDVLSQFVVVAQPVSEDFIRFDGGTYDYTILYHNAIL